MNVEMYLCFAFDFSSEASSDDAAQENNQTKDNHY